MKEKIILLLSVLIGLGAFYLTNRYLASERQKLMAGVEKIKIVVAGRDLPTSTVLKQGDLAMRDEIKSAVGDNFITPEDYLKILDKRLLFPLKMGAPLLWSQVEAAERARRGLSATIKVGMRALSISVSGAETVSGLVQPSDHVDIIGTFSLPSRTTPGEMETVTLTVLQDVSVLACGSQLARPESLTGGSDSFRSGGYNMVTLEVTPREAELLTFIQHMRGLGQLTLSLRHQDDVSFEKDMPEIDFKRLEGALPELNLYRQRTIRRKTNL
jgi:pilus assembly protein CpaB